MSGRARNVEGQAGYSAFVPCTAVPVRLLDAVWKWLGPRGLREPPAILGPITGQLGLTGSHMVSTAVPGLTPVSVCPLTRVCTWTLMGRPLPRDGAGVPRCTRGPPRLWLRGGARVTLIWQLVGAPASTVNCISCFFFFFRFCKICFIFYPWRISTHSFFF